MNNPIFPKKLQAGDIIGVIAPARSLSGLGKEITQIAINTLQSLGLEVVFAKNVYEKDIFNSSSVASRVEDLHWAFSDPNIDGILTVIGGFNCNQLFSSIDWDLIRNNPKPLCGFSDITALGNAIYAKTRLVTYSGPHFSTFGQKKGNKYTVEYFKKCLMSEDSFVIGSSSHWSDDAWYKDQDNRKFIKNDGFYGLNDGKVTGHIIGGNQCTLNLLQGTEYMPSLDGAILFLEDDYEAHAATFDRDLQSLIHLPEFAGVKGIAIGRFQPVSEMTKERLKQIIDTKPELKNLPVVVDVDFGHTDPRITFPIGGMCSIEVSGREAKIEITQH